MKERKKEDFRDYYVILEQIGYGFYGNVYKGIKKATKELRAIKVIDLNKMRKNLLNSFELNEIEDQIKSYINGFINEYETMNICSKNNINSVKCYEYFINNDYFVIIMELCDKNLFLLLKERKKRGETFNEKEIFEIINQLNNTFKIMKDNKIIHRDLKLDNILIKYNEDKTFTLKLTGYLLFFPKYYNIYDLECLCYKAPEILRESPNYNYKIDLWSLGIIIYKLFFKVFPFNGYTEKALLNCIQKGGQKLLKSTENKELDNLIRNLLQEDPEKRLTWDKYFIHPFFIKNKRINEDYKNYYEILTAIGQGAYGNVYKGKEKGTNELRAIKIMDLNKMRENLLNSLKA